MNSKLVMAYVDGELDSTQAAEFEAQIAADPALQRAVQRERDLRAALSAAYDPVLAEPVPPALRALLSAPAQVISLDAARAARSAPPAPASAAWRWREWGAMAACLMLGLTLGLSGPWRATDAAPALARSADGTLLAQGALDVQLSSALASEPAAAGVSVSLSFAARDARYGYCRSFVMQGGQATAGLACRGAEGWVVQALAPAAVQPEGGYRTAATALPPALLQMVDQMRATDPLDADAERAARDRGWKR